MIINVDFRFFPPLISSRRVETATRLLMAAGLRSISVEQPPTLKDTNIFTIFATRNR